MFTIKDNEDDDQAGGSTGEGKKKKPRREVAQAKAVFMEGIPNVKPVIDMEIATEVQKRIKSLTGFKTSGFPGCQPVSMDRANIQMLKNPYMVSWKADGTR
jgi:mRNA-capping enzyme